MIFRQYAPARPPFTLVVRRCFSWIKCVIKRYILRQQSVFIYSPFSRIYNPSEPKFADKKFISRISHSRELFDDSGLRKEVAKGNYEAFIVGSDQVWREEYSPRIETFFLDFLPESDKRPRIAYAASLGKEHSYISEEKMPDCKRLLSRFDAVSVREYGAIDALKRDFGYHEAIKVLDPTLLLKADDYQALIEDKDRNSRHHIAAYILDDNGDKNAILDDCTKTLNLPVEQFSGEFDGKPMLTVSQWLENFASADYVVTDSFHGCVFSIIFHKPFIAIANHERGLDRFVSLLRDAGLEDRLVLSYDDYLRRKDGLIQATDYAKVEHLLEPQRQKSFKFLKDALSQNRRTPEHRPI